MKRSLLPLSVLLLLADPTLAQQLSPPAARSSPQWGGTDRILHRVGKAAFTPYDSSVNYSVDVGLYSTSGTGIFLADLQLPSGALLTYFELDYCDTSPGAAFAFIQQCHFLGANCTDHPALVSNDGPSGCNYVTTDLTPQNIVIDNNQYAYEIVGVTPTNNGATQLIGVYVGYKLQVSPAPATATFADVPTNHPLFRFVEALFRSGITAGCGGGNFCPDAPLTRGQMAVFLSVALGLHFPN